MSNNKVSLLIENAQRHFMRMSFALLAVIFLLNSCVSFNCMDEKKNFIHHKNNKIGSRVDTAHFMSYVGKPYMIETLDSNKKLYKFKIWHNGKYCFWSAQVDSKSMKMLNWVIDSNPEHCVRFCRNSVF